MKSSPIASLRLLSTSVLLLLSTGLGWARDLGYPSWMTPLPGTLKLREMSIPGTHDSGATSGGKLATCQEMGIEKQLTAGIRFFDLRLDWDWAVGKLRVYHGQVAQNLFFLDVQKTFIEYLSSHPGETILLKVQHEQFAGRDLIKSDVPLSQRFQSEMDRNHYACSVDLDITLQEARGKIILLDNSSFDPGPGNRCSLRYGELNAQDDYQFSDLKSGSDRKMESIKAQFRKAAANNGRSWYVNFTSFSCSRWTEALYNPFANIFYPEDAAKEINPRVYRYLINDFHGSHAGTVVMDFPDSHLIGKIISYNWQAHRFRLKIKTADLRDAGTDANVYLTLNGSNGSWTFEPKHSIGYDAYEQNALDEVDFGMPKDIGRIQSVTAWTDAAGKKSGWCLEYIQLDDPTEPDGYVKFLFNNQWFYTSGAKTTVSRMAVDHRYEMLIKTCDEKYAGTDANVTVQMNGARASHAFDPKSLGIPGDAYEQNHTDRLSFSLQQALGPIQSITVWFDAHGKNSGWCLETIQIRTPESPSNWIVFPFHNQWFYSAGVKNTAKRQ